MLSHLHLQQAREDELDLLQTRRAYPERQLRSLISARCWRTRGRHRRSPPTTTLPLSSGLSDARLPRSQGSGIIAPSIPKNQPHL